MSTVKTLWAVIGGLVTIGVAFGVLNLADSQFEKLVLAGVVVIYATVARGVAGAAQLALAQTRSVYGQYIELRTILGKPDESESAAMRTMDERFEASTPQFYIRVASLWIAEFIGLCFLVAALLR